MCCIYCAEEDRYGSYARLLLKYFLAEGVMCGHALFVASASEQGEDILKVSMSTQLHRDDVISFP